MYIHVCVYVGTCMFIHMHVYVYTCVWNEVHVSVVCCVWCVQIQVYTEGRMDSPLVTSAVDIIGFFELSPLPNRSEVLYIDTCI